MPSPIGHALGGIVVGLLASRRPSVGLLAICAIAAALPDVDFLLPMRHRGPSHSVGAAVLVGALGFAASALAGSRFPVPGSRFRVLGSGFSVRGSGFSVVGSLRLGLVVAAAYATHVLFDWLGADSSAPRGLMALWPFSADYYVSDLAVFNSVDRRYWLPGFWWRSLLSLLRELAVLGPLVLLAWWTTRYTHR